jgi:F-type H+-transporting ATPase subunit gamma
MKNYLFYTTKIKGFKAVEETVRVIEKSAASHIHFLKKKVQFIFFYKNQIRAALDRLSRFYWDADHPLLQEGTRKSSHKALLVVAGAKGVVGGLYHELINEVIIRKNLYHYIWVIGNKGKGYLNEEGVQAEELFSASGSKEEFRPQEINKISSDLFSRFQSIGLKKIDVIYPRFFSLAKQRPHIVQFLPFDFVSARNSALAANNGNDSFPIFEPSKKFIFDILIKKYIDVSFAELILEAKLSEFAARTVTAESAIKEIEELISSLRRVFLKEKHRAVTQKQIESFSVHQIT